MHLWLEVAESTALPMRTRERIVDLCTEAYEEDFTEYLDHIGPGVHVLAWIDATLVSHAMWVARWLQAGERPALRTAYVEAVATRAEHRRSGFASALLVRLADEIRDHDLGALSPTDERFYARLGWQVWRGPLFIRRDADVEPTPDESVMILRLPRTPANLDVTEALSAEWRRGEVW